MNKTSTKKSNKRVKYLSVRLSETEKERLEQEAESQGSELSDYVRTILVKKTKKNDNVAACVVLCQELVNYIWEKYGNHDDWILEEKMEEIWGALL